MLERLRKEVADLKEVINLSDGLRRDLRSAAEQVILESPLVAWGRWLLGAVIAAGFAVWFGGVIYGRIQIKSLQEQSKAALHEMREELKAQAAAVTIKSDEAISEINSQRERARRKLAVDALPDLANLKAAISALEESGRRLDLKTLSALSHWSVLALFGVAAVAFVAGVAALFQARHSRIRRLAKG